MPKSALILIDIQNDYFPDFSNCRMPLPKMRAATDNSSKLLSSARACGIRIIHVQHIAASETAPFFRPGSKGAKINQMVLPQGNEPIIEKGRPNSFVGTNLHTDLQKIGVTDIMLCGAMSQMCIDATARAAVDLGYKVTIAHDACAASDIVHDGIDVPAEMVHAAIMAPLAASYARVASTETCLKIEADRMIEK